MVSIERYYDGMKEEWNGFVADSRNGFFLFDRNYMDYHADRFEDFSLVARDAKGRLLALLPAAIEGDVLCSHPGLTFGGWLLPPRRCDQLDMLEIWDAMTDFLRARGIGHVVYKAIPYIYDAQPAQEDIYALFRAGARLSTVLASSVVDLADPLPFDQGSRQRARRALNSDVDFGRSDDWEGFWAVLEDLLRERYGSRPVHSLEEIRLLASRFPDNIRLYTVREAGRIIAGTVLYVGPRAVHSQYTAASPRGKELSVIPGLYSKLIAELQTSGSGIRYFDFGTSNENGGRDVNEGLLRQKCSYGARAVAYSTYSLTL